LPTAGSATDAQMRNRICNCVLMQHRRRYKTSEMYARIREERGTN
jgi:hypothetical protein